MDVTAIDEAVKRAQALCREAAALPDPSALQTLLRYAKGTDSCAEVALFVRYQAARATGRDRQAQPFLHAVAEEIEHRYGDDILALRRFLGFLVRAGKVEKAQRDERSRQQRQRPTSRRG